MTSHRRLVAALCAVVVLAGCSVPVPSDPVDGPVWRWTQPWSGQGNAALISGTLRLQSGCLLVEGDGGPFLVVWPAGTAWDAGRSAVVTPDGVALPVDADVEGAGGYVDVGEVGELLGEEVGAQASRCGSTGAAELAVFNNAKDAARPAP